MYSLYIYKIIPLLFYMILWGEWKQQIPKNNVYDLIVV